MFNTTKVAQKIREARISQNMTQMNLADAMEVSYQAVSNWERGNSMPDIAKLEQLCQILQLSIDELLGSGSAADTIIRVINKETPSDAESEPIAMNDIQEIAPLLPPNDMEQLIKNSLSQQGENRIHFAELAGLAPFLDQDYLDELVREIPVGSLKELASLAPFVSEETLDALIRKADVEADMSGILALAPFLQESTLSWLAGRLSETGNPEIVGLYPYLPQEDLQKMAKHFIQGNDMKSLKSILPFV